ncbi:MAG: hypothetical protein ACYSUQ_06185 [Planctomycetota bacterium]
MPVTQTSTAILDGEFLEIRRRLLEIAAALDRIDRGQNAEAIRSDPRLAELLEAAGVLTDGGPDRAERV